jgi:hypothetical protein
VRQSNNFRAENQETEPSCQNNERVYSLVSPILLLLDGHKDERVVKPETNLRSRVGMNLKGYGYGGDPRRGGVIFKQC